MAHRRLTFIIISYNHHHHHQYHLLNSPLGDLGWGFLALIHNEKTETQKGKGFVRSELVVMQG